MEVVMGTCAWCLGPIPAVLPEEYDRPHWCESSDPDGLPGCDHEVNAICPRCYADGEDRDHCDDCPCAVEAEFQGEGATPNRWYVVLSFGKYKTIHLLVDQATEEEARRAAVDLYHEQRDKERGRV